MLNRYFHYVTMFSEDGEYETYSSWKTENAGFRENIQFTGSQFKC